jgi:hypothetical protein
MLILAERNRAASGTIPARMADRSRSSSGNRPIVVGAAIANQSCVATNNPPPEIPEEPKPEPEIPTPTQPPAPEQQPDPEAPKPEIPNPDPNKPAGPGTVID